MRRSASTITATSSRNLPGEQKLSPKEVDQYYGLAFTSCVDGCWSHLPVSEELLNTSLVITCESLSLEGGRQTLTFPAFSWARAQLRVFGWAGGCTCGRLRFAGKYHAETDTTENAFCGKCHGEGVWLWGPSGIERLRPVSAMESTMSVPGGPVVGILVLRCGRVSWLQG